MPAIPPRCRGVSDQRLQTRGGERWPGGSVGDAARTFPSRRFKPRRPGVPTARRWAPVMALRTSGHRISSNDLGPQRWIGLDAKAGGPETGSPPGAARSRPSNTARGTPWDLADLRLVAPELRKERRRTTDFSMPRCCEASRSVGPSTLVCAHCASLCAPRTRSVPRALGTRSRAADWTSGLRRTRRRPKNTGDDACLPSFRGAPKARTRNPEQERSKHRDSGFGP